MEKFKTINTKAPFKFELDKTSLMFSKGKIYVLYVDENRNQSFISKETVEKNIETLKNIPIVGQFKKMDSGEGNFGGHGGKFLIENGEIEYVHTTVPLGLIPESFTYSWEMVTDEEGNEKEYLVVDNALFWNRYSREIETLKADEYGQSMELEHVEGYFDKEKNLFVISDFIFSALCILGIDKDGQGHVEPCFEDARVITYSTVDQESFKLEFHEMLNELKFELSNDSTNKNIIKKGDGAMLKKLLEKYSITMEQFEEKIANYSELTDEELEAKATEVFEVVEPVQEPSVEPIVVEPVAEPIAEPTSEPVVEPIVEEPTQTLFVKVTREFELSHEDVRSKIWNLLDSYIESNELGYSWNYWVGEVFDTYFIALGDKKNYKISYTKTDDAVELTGHVEVFVQYLTAEQKASLESMQNDFEIVKEEFEVAKKELVELKEFKQETEKAIHESQAEELFAQSGLEESEIEEIRANVNDLTLEQVEEKLFALIGRKALSGKKFSRQTDNGKIHLPLNSGNESNKEQDHPYGSLFRNNK